MTLTIRSVYLPRYRHLTPHFRAKITGVVAPLGHIELASRSRLYKSLVYEKKLAQNVEAEQSSGDLASRFVIGVMARPGVSLDKLEAA